jgi:hypothetical protein
LLSALSISQIASGLRSGEPWLNWLAGLILWILLLILALRRELVLGQDGLRYTDVFTTVHVPWPQVVRLETRKTLGIWSAEGLEVWFESPKPKDLFIDLTQFDRSWRQDALGAILREKAPQIFDKSIRSPDSV